MDEKFRKETVEYVKRFGLSVEELELVAEAGQAATNAMNDVIYEKGKNISDIKKIAMAVLAVQGLHKATEKVLEEALKAGNGKIYIFKK